MGSCRQKWGLTILEVVIAIAILAVLVSPVIDLLLVSGRGNLSSIDEIVNTNLANELADSLSHADSAFLQASAAISAGNWVNLLPMDAARRKLYLQSRIPEQVHELAFSLEPVAGATSSPASYLLRVRALFMERAQERELRLARFVAGPSR